MEINKAACFFNALFGKVRTYALACGCHFSLAAKKSNQQKLCGLGPPCECQWFGHAWATRAYRHAALKTVAFGLCGHLLVNYFKAK